MYKYSEKGADELNIAERVEFYEQELIEHRRWLHRHAELAWKEFETTEYIENYLKELGLEPMIFGDLALGEGTGAVLLFPMLDMAHAVYQENRTFAHIHVEAYQDFDEVEHL